MLHFKELLPEEEQANKDDRKSKTTSEEPPPVLVLLSELDPDQNSCKSKYDQCQA